jgi:RHS repeat-associated protein
MPHPYRNISDSIAPMECLEALFASPHRFTFNGKENDNDVKGEGNSLDFGARVYDSRIARFLSFDPYYSILPSISPFSYGANNPIIFIDNEGKNPILSIIGLTGLIAGSTILAELTGSSIAWTVTIEGKAGAAAVGSGQTGSIGLAVDPLGNYALIASGGAFAHIFYLGGNTNKNDNSSSDENDGPSEGGLWYFGGAAGISVDFSYLDQYSQISDFTGEASKFQVDIGTFSDFGGAIITDPAKKQVKGLTLLFDAGISLGFGMIDNKTYVIGFTKRDISNSSTALTKQLKP